MYGRSRARRHARRRPRRDLAAGARGARGLASRVDLQPLARAAAAVVVQGTTLLLSAPGGGAHLGRAPLRRRARAALRRQDAAVDGGRLRRAGRTRRRARRAAGARLAAARSRPHLRPLRHRPRQPARPRRRACRRRACRARPTTRCSCMARRGSERPTCSGAIAEYLRRNHPELTVHYTTAERFTSEFVAALRRDGPGAVQGPLPRARRAADRRRPGARGKAAHRGGVRPHLQRAATGRQADRALQRPPAGGALAARRAPARPLRWGLRSSSSRRTCAPGSRCCGAWPPTPSRDCADPAVLHEIATRVPDNVRLLEGAMTRVLAVASLLSEPLSVPGRAPRAGPSGRAGCLGCANTDAGGDSGRGLRDQRAHSGGVDLAAALAAVARARQMAMYLARELTPLSLAEIARGFDRDHTTVLHAIRAVSAGSSPAPRPPRPSTGSAPHWDGGPVVAGP